MKASEIVFQRLLDGKTQYRVPLFQRTYDWAEKEWERIWEDLLEIYAMDKPRNHFIGSVVTQLIPDAPENVNKYMLIDGQQRMTTLLILLSVIRHLAESDSETWSNLSEEIQDTCLINKFAEQQDEQIKLMPTQRDRESFRTLVKGEIPSDETQIGRAWKYFCKVLQQEDMNKDKIDLKNMKECIVNHLDMVSIHLDQDDSPNRIFESLNNTGRPLSVSDLIRNYLFMNIHDLSEQEHAYNTYWYPMQETLSQDNNDPLSDFFWRYLMMKGSLSRKDETFEDMRQALNKPTLLTPQRTMETLQEFHQFSRYYAQLIELDSSYLDNTVLDQIRRLNQWQVDVAYPFFMRALDYVDANAISQDSLVEVML